MLPARQRIKRSEFPQKKLCRTYYGKFFLLHYLKSGNHLPKVSVVVGKKHSPSSVQRHRIKRAVYEYIYQISDALPRGSVLVFHSVNKISKENNKQSLIEDVQTCIGQLMHK